MLKSGSSSQPGGSDWSEASSAVDCVVENEDESASAEEEGGASEGEEPPLLEDCEV